VRGLEKEIVEFKRLSLLVADCGWVFLEVREAVLGRPKSIGNF
jgi:hypothetical protein